MMDTILNHKIQKKYSTVREKKNRAIWKDPIDSQN
jgi:hypothetical protein